MQVPRWLINKLLNSPHTRFQEVMLRGVVCLYMKRRVGDVATLEAAQLPAEVVLKKRELLAKIMKSKGLKRLKEILEQFITDIHEK